MKRMFQLISFLFLFLIMLYSCGDSELSEARRIYEANATMYKRALQEPELRQAIALIENYLSRQPNDPAAHVLLWKCLLKLRSPEKDTVRNRLIALGNLIQIDLIRALKDEAESVRREAASLIGDMNINRASSELVHILENDEYYDVQRAAALALSKMKSTEAIEPLLEKLKSTNAQVRYYAACALGAFKDARVIRALLSRIKATDETSDVRHQAAMSLATVCNQNDISDLAEIFNDETQRTDSRILAASILSVLGDFRGYDFILQIANSGENNYHRGLAITALGNFNRPETVEVLRNVAKYGNKALRIRAAEALGEIGTPEAISVIQILLDDSNQAVQESAQNALQKIEHKAN